MGERAQNTIGGLIIKKICNAIFGYNIFIYYGSIYIYSIELNILMKYTTFEVFILLLIFI